MNELDVFKKDSNVQKFMKKYRYQYHVTMLPDLAALVRNAYLEGYNNGLLQHPVPSDLKDSKKPTKSDHRYDYFDEEDYRFGRGKGNFASPNLKEGESDG